jgi:hypothetical protein
MNINQLTSNSTAQTVIEYLQHTGVTRPELDALLASQPRGRASAFQGSQASMRQLASVPPIVSNTQAVSAAGAPQPGPHRGQGVVQVGPQGQYITPAAAATAPAPGLTLQQQAAAIQSAMAAVPGYNPQGSKLGQYRAIRQHDRLQGMNWNIDAMQAAVGSYLPSYFTDVDRQFEPDTIESAEVRRAAQASPHYPADGKPAQKYKALLELKEEGGKAWSRWSMTKIADIADANAIKVEKVTLAPTGTAGVIRDEAIGSQPFRTKAEAYQAILDHNDAHQKGWLFADMRRAAQIDASQAAEVEFHRHPAWREVLDLRNAVQNEPEYAGAETAKDRYQALLRIKQRTSATWAERDMMKLSGILLANAGRIHRDMGLPRPSRPVAPDAPAPGRT